MTSCAVKYAEEAPKLIGSPPKLNLRPEALPSASAVASQMRIIIREAQKDFHFASIYEQRRTNQLLVTGFRSLNDAIMNVGERLEGAIDSLTETVRQMAESQIEKGNDLLAGIDRLEQTIKDDSAGRCEQERETRELLERIEKRRGRN